MRMSSLEELKSREREVDFLLGGTRFREDWDWLIEQAERVQELERQNKLLRFIAEENKIAYERRTKQNERYQEAIVEAIKLNLDDDFNYDIDKILNEVLVSEE